MTAIKIASFKMGRINTDLPVLRPDSDSQTRRIVVGFDGRFGDNWTWSTHYEYGQTRYSARVFNNIINSNFTNALNAVVNPANGQIVCASSLKTPGNGCAPLDLFGVGSPSAAATSYIEGTESELVHLTESSAAASIQGEPFQIWAGPVSVAAGAEYRRETLSQNVDPISAAGGFVEGNPKSIDGSYEVEEGFAETVVPLIHDMFLVKSLDLNAAARVTNYSNNGTVETWKVGVTYSVDDDLRLRFTRSRDIRAPDLSELFTQYLLTFGTVIDPVSGKQVQVSEPSQGNPDLKPEIADTTTGGIIYQPSWFRGFNASVDVFNIDVKGIVGTLTAQQIVNDCALGSSAQCGLITRDTTGVITSVLRAQQNLSELKTAGIDFEGSYQRRLPEFFGPLQGNVALRMLATYTNELTTVSQGVSINEAGAVGSGVTGVPRWRWNASLTYVRGSFQLFLQALYVGGGNVDNSLGPLGYSPDRVGGQAIGNVTATYDLISNNPGRVELFFNIHNIANAAPPIDPSSFIFQYQTNPSLYDVIGRTFTVGARFHY
jgi:iron complex outermembrane recepter protein